MTNGPLNIYSDSMLLYKRLFGKRLRMLREIQMSAAEFADAMDVKQATVSRWETGSMFPKEDQFDRICEVLNIKQDYFILGNDVEAKFIVALVNSFRAQQKQIAADMDMIHELQSINLKLRDELESFKPKKK